jgi:DNA-binding beta-propeller fold protein YncE
MRRILALTLAVLGVLSSSSSATTTSAGRPVALVTAETSDEVIAISLGPPGGHVIRRVHLADPLMIASGPHGPAVVVNPSGIVTLLALHSLRPIRVFHSFRTPKVAAVAPNGRFAYVTDEGTGDLTVLDLARREIVGRVFVGREAHHLGISPDGRRIWVALGETATTIVRLDSSNPRKPRVLGPFHPQDGAHDVSFAPDGRTVWVTSPSKPYVAGYSVSGRHLWTAGAGRPPGHVAFSGSRALVPSGYGSVLWAFTWSSPSRAPNRASAQYGSFNLATYAGFVVTTSLMTGQVSEYRVGDLHRLWTTKVAPAARYVAISVWPR